MPQLACTQKIFAKSSWYQELQGISISETNYFVAVILDKPLSREVGEGSLSQRLMGC